MYDIDEKYIRFIFLDSTLIMLFINAVLFFSPFYDLLLDLIKINYPHMHIFKKYIIAPYQQYIFLRDISSIFHLSFAFSIKD